jgi:hypothetical protein
MNNAALASKLSKSDRGHYEFEEFCKYLYTLLNEVLKV